MPVSGPGQGSPWSASRPTESVPLECFLRNRVSTLPVAIVPTDGGSILLTESERFQEELRGITEHFVDISEGQHVDEAVATEQQEQVEGTVAMPNREEESPPDPGAASTPPEHEDMDTHTGLANLQAGKRPRDQTNSLATTQDSSGGDEPPPKAPGDAATGKMVTLPASKSKLEERREPPAGEPQDQGPAVVKAATSKDTCQPTSEDTKVAENQETSMEVVESASGQPIKRPLEESVEEKADKRDLAKVSGPNVTTGQQPADQPLEPQPEIATASERPESSEPPSKEPDATAGQDNMDQSESAAGGLAGKRPWDEGRDETSTPDSGGGGEPPTKAAGNRRPSFKPRPTIPAGPRAEAKPPLQSTPPG
ncbi:hypothetical protein HPB49_014483 [Dermacentor silvarum]|uniref:Uncharacterized protein n=1 Tax=Dermacentor silvarum TaxID=543639 RepID=A0ACB8D5X6_DERSI|nr:hypothetical protein HPB49_014483 [Dermacentor silvarum]